MKVSVKERRNRKTGKPETVISGITHNPQVIDKLEKKMKSSCGAGGYTDKKVIYIQGSHVEKISSILQKEGYQVS